MNKELILLDTDIGSDIDDAFALAYLLKQPRCELLGITTVTGMAAERAMLASALCTVAGRADIPIYPGSAAPLLGAVRQPKAPQAERLEGYDYKREFERGTHIEFMRKTIRANAGEVTLLAIGPLTNIALLFATDPEIPRMLKRLVLMAGVFDHRLSDWQTRVEWNIYCDPYAAAAVYAAPTPDTLSVGLDVTTRVVKPFDDAKRLFTSDVLRAVADFGDVWNREGNKNIVFHDPLAAALIFNPGICTYGEGVVTVDLDSHTHRGMLTFGRGEGNQTIATDVNPDMFFAEFGVADA